MDATQKAAMYTERRRRLSAQIDEGIAFISSPGMSPDPLLYDKNLEYLTGLKSRRAVLLLAPRDIVVESYETLFGPEVGRGHLVKEVLFVEERTERDKMMDGPGMGYDDIRSVTGVDKVFGLSKLNDVLTAALMGESVLWVNVGTRPTLGVPPSADLVHIREIRDLFPWLQIRNIAGLIHKMRRVKEPYEIECLRRAFEIHTDVYEKIMRALKPGTNERLGEAIWEYETRLHGADVTGDTLDFHANQIIVGSGRNTAVAHYMDNNQEIHDGDLVLLDAGVAVDGYSSDITRTFPANGKFTPRQRELYAIVLEAQKQAIATMRPGSNARNAHEAVYRVVESHGLGKYNFGNCGHPVGLNIHDATSMGTWDRDYPFEPGAVLVIEPFLVMPEEGIGIRIEDGVLITANGHELLKGPVKEIADVEALCRR